MDTLLEELEEALSAGMIDGGLGGWRARAARLQEEWESAAPRLRDRDLTASDIDLVVALVGGILATVERHPSIAPSHGVGHARRVTAHGVLLAASEELGRPDAARLLIAAAAHDLGRLALAQDTGALDHAEVSGVLFETMREALAPLPEAVRRASAQAVLAHSRPPAHERLWFRTLDDIRSCDGLDNGGTGAGFVRCALHGSSFADLGAALPAREPDQEVWLDWWRHRSENRNPPRIAASAWARAERDVRDAQARRLIASLPEFDGDPAGMPDAFEELALAVEPDLPSASSDRIRRRLSELPDHEARRWAGALAVVRDSYAAEASRLSAAMEAAVRQGDDLLASVAARLLADGVARLPGQTPRPPARLDGAP